MGGRRNGDDLKGLMGTAHKIKGSAASIGLNRIAKLAHLMEDLLQELLADARLALQRADRRLLEMHRCPAAPRGRTEAGDGSRIISGIWPATAADSASRIGKRGRVRQDHISRHR